MCAVRWKFWLRKQTAIEPLMDTNAHGLRFNRERLTWHFACRNPERMKWSVDGGLAQCLGCSGSCGTSQIEGNFEREIKLEQQELL